MKKEPHINKEIIIAWANGQTIKCRRKGDMYWTTDDRNFKTSNPDYEYKIKRNWYEEIPNGGILCWVSDGDISEKFRVRLITSFINHSHYRFRDAEDFIWTYATPLTTVESHKHSPEDSSCVVELPVRYGWDLWEAFACGETIEMYDNGWKPWDKKDFNPRYEYRVKPREWYHNLPEGGILCWVGDLEDRLKEQCNIDFVVEYDEESDYPFRAKTEGFVYAQPLTKEEMVSFLNNNILD
jgi:hypothetical protein